MENNEDLFYNINTEFKSLAAKCYDHIVNNKLVLKP